MCEQPNHCEDDVSQYVAPFFLSWYAYFYNQGTGFGAGKISTSAEIARSDTGMW